jgi:hypothetical protein
VGHTLPLARFATLILAIVQVASLQNNAMKKTENEKIYYLMQSRMWQTMWIKMK